LEIIENSSKPQPIAPTVVYAPSTTNAPTTNIRGGSSSQTNIASGTYSELNYGLPRGASGRQ